MQDARTSSADGPHNPAKSPETGPDKSSELLHYYLVVAAYFFAFGMQFVLYPSLVAFVMHETPERVGLAQVAISAPMFCLLLFGGVLAERAQTGPALALLQVGFAIFSLTMAGLIATNLLSYPLLISYAICVGALAAFVMPVRDAALNGVLAREAALGRHTSIAKAAAATTAVQIAAQIAGIVLAQFAGSHPAPFFAIQALVLALAAAASLLLRAPKPTGHERTLTSAVRDVRAGLAYAFKSPVMAPMLISAAYAGVFIVGSFQVLFPLIVRDAYGGDAATQAERLSALLAAFWSASFVSAALLSRLKPLAQPGRALILSHMVSAAVLFAFSFDKPFWAFLAVVMIWGLAAGVTMSMSRTIVQSQTETAFLGRVLAVYSMGFMGGAPIGSAMVGFAAGEFGARGAALMAAIGLALAAVLLAALTPIWRINVAAAAHGRDGG